MRYISIIALMYSSFLLAQNLPELKTKQSLDNIRLISNEGKFTYYQQRSGHLNMSTNYSNKVVMKNPKGTFYLLTSTEERKRITIEVFKDYHKNLDFYSLNEIFTIPFGKTNPKKVGIGKLPKLHVKDNWITFFNPLERKIYIKNLLANAAPLSIKLKNKVNPYFIPEAVMPTPDTILYTDINDQGYMALQMYTLSDKKFKTVYKSKFTGIRLDFCRLNDDIFVGEFSYDGVNRGSSIIKIPIFNNKNFKNSTTIYQSELPDIGHLTCSGSSIFFIKTTKYNPKINARNSEAVEIDLSSDKVKTLTSLNYVTNILNMDGMILVPFRHHYYVAKGKSLLNEDALKVKRSKEGKDE